MKFKNIEIETDGDHIVLRIPLRDFARYWAEEVEDEEDPADEEEDDGDDDDDDGWK